MTTLRQLEYALTTPGERPGAVLPVVRTNKLSNSPRKGASIRTTVTSINDIMKGVARASIPSRPDRYWTHTITSRDVWLPRQLDFYGAMGCLIITALMIIAVFR